MRSQISEILAKVAALRHQAEEFIFNVVGKWLFRSMAGLCLLYIPACWIGNIAVSRPLNQPLRQHQPESGYRFAHVVDAKQRSNNSNSLFLCLAFSGGGSRAAALAYGVLHALQNTKITWKGQRKSLLDEVDCISSVSGGSFTAAYYALYGKRIFRDFPSVFFDTKIERNLLLQTIPKIFHLASSHYSRIDMAADYYDNLLFRGKTYKDLLGKKPFLIINATDVVSGAPFPFTQTQFDLLGSDLSSFPIARAVAASSAYPIGFSALALKNYNQPKGWKRPQSIDSGLLSMTEDPTRYKLARLADRYLEMTQHKSPQKRNANRKKRPWVHLLDGGLADNTGTKSVLHSFGQSSGLIRRLILSKKQNKIEKLVVLVVNAQTRMKDALSHRPNPPGIATIAYKSVSISMDINTFDNIQQLREVLDLRHKAQREDLAIDACKRALRACQKRQSIPVDGPYYPLRQVGITFVGLGFQSIQNEKERDELLGLPTTLYLKPKHIKKILAFGAKALKRSTSFQRLLSQLQPARKQQTP